MRHAQNEGSGSNACHRNQAPSVDGIRQPRRTRARCSEHNIRCRDLRQGDRIRTGHVRHGAGDIAEVEAVGFKNARMVDKIGQRTLQGGVPKLLFRESLFIQAEPRDGNFFKAHNPRATWADIGKKRRTRRRDRNARPRQVCCRGEDIEKDEDRQQRNRAGKREPSALDEGEQRRPDCGENGDAQGVCAQSARSEKDNFHWRPGLAREHGLHHHPTRGAKHAQPHDNQTQIAQLARRGE